MIFQISLLILTFSLSAIAIANEPDCEVIKYDGYGGVNIDWKCGAEKSKYRSKEHTANARYSREFIVQDLPLSRYRYGKRGISDAVADLKSKNISYSLATMSPKATNCGALNIHFASELYGDELDVELTSIGNPGYLQCDLVLRNTADRVRVLTVLLGHDLNGGDQPEPFIGPRWGHFSDFGRLYPDLVVEPVIGLGDSAGWASPAIHNTALLKVIEDGTEAAIFGAVGKSYDEQQPAPLPLLAVLLAQFVHDVTTD